MSSQDEQLRDHVLYLLRGRGAHADFDTAVEGFPEELRGARAPNIPYTPWGQLEHLRICQWDILEYSRDSNHVSPEWPAGYWPESDGPPTPEAWEDCVEAFRTDLKAMQDLVSDPATDLFAQIPHGKAGHTVLREALLLADHNAYHIGQLVVLRRALGGWDD